MVLFFDNTNTKNARTHFKLSSDLIQNLIKHIYILCKNRFIKYKIRNVTAISNVPLLLLHLFLFEKSNNVRCCFNFKKFEQFTFFVFSNYTQFMSRTFNLSTISIIIKYDKTNDTKQRILR